MMRFTTKLLPSRTGNLGILQLNNPKALNALTLDMIHCIQDTLAEWTTQGNAPAAILLRSNVEESKIPSFCAGGDVKGVYLAVIEEGSSSGHGKRGLASADFFRDEYTLNHRLATLSTSSLAPKDCNNESGDPVIISFWDGLVMGGGVGLSIYGKFRVATERTVWAMPECGIGLFPDVGSLYWMPRLLNEDMAVYLALTGRRLDASDLLYTGLATHYVSSSQLEQLQSALAEATANKRGATEDALASALNSLAESPVPDSKLESEASHIDKYFGNTLSDPQSRAHDIIEKLQKDSNAFTEATLATMAKQSPTSMALTLEGLKRGLNHASIGEDLKMEYRIGQACVRHADRPDFFEGIRAALVDKDHNPKWNVDVDDTYISSLFQPIEDEWEIPKLKTNSRL